MAARIRKGDKVVVIAGRDKGKTGEVIRMITDENRAVVRGVNIVRRHQRQTASAQGGIITKEMPIHVSNIAIADANGKATRVGFKMVGDRKVRFSKRTGETIDG
jgi:large subunit ribosomal protein L24